MSEHTRVRDLAGMIDQGLVVPPSGAELSGDRVWSAVIERRRRAQARRARRRRGSLAALITLSALALAGAGASPAVRAFILLIRGEEATRHPVNPGPGGSASMLFLDHAGNVAELRIDGTGYGADGAAPGFVWRSDGADDPGAIPLHGAER